MNRLTQKFHSLRIIAGRGNSSRSSRVKFVAIRQKVFRGIVIVGFAGWLAFSRTTQYLAAEIGNWVCGPKTQYFALPPSGDCSPRSFGRKTGPKALTLNEEEGLQLLPRRTKRPSSRQVRSDQKKFGCHETRLGRQTFRTEWWFEAKNRKSRLLLRRYHQRNRSLLRHHPKKPAAPFSPATFWLHCGKTDIGKEGVGETSVGFLLQDTIRPISKSLEEEFADSRLST